MQELISCHAANLRRRYDTKASAHVVSGNGFTRRLLLFVMMLSVVIMLIAVQTVFAQERVVQAEGKATEVEREAVIIDRAGYITTRTTKVFDLGGKRVRIEDLRLPIKVRFEYVYTDKGPVILSITAVGD